MRITADEKAATRVKILAAAAELFKSQGFEATTTRDIARAAGIASGTLFNYFAAKEGVVAALAAEALAKARAEFATQEPGETLEESLFALCAAEMRRLKPLRKLLAPLLERSFSPLPARQLDGEDALRADHLEAVSEICRRHGRGELSPVAWQLYWTLYTGALAFWAADSSPKQEDTLALLDESLAMFVAWLGDESGSAVA